MDCLNLILNHKRQRNNDFKWRNGEKIMEKKYTIKSVSDEGVYYLMNGWNKCKTFWFSEESVLKDVENAKRFFFNKPSQAKASLTKLLKVMEDYRNDIFEVVEF